MSDSSTQTHENFISNPTKPGNDCQGGSIDGFYFLCDIITTTVPDDRGMEKCLVKYVAYLHN